MNKDIGQLPTIVIFGRANVGKSTLFNCLLEKKKALVSETAGTTRDANIGVASWNDREFKLVDTGGIIEINNLWAKTGKKKKTSLGGKTDDIGAKVQIQAREYIKQADLILFLTDARDGLLPQDRQMAVLVKKIISSNKAGLTPLPTPRTGASHNPKIILVANKADNPKLRHDTVEFNQLGLGEPMPVSAATGSGTGDLLDLIVSKLQKVTSDECSTYAKTSSAADALADMPVDERMTNAEILNQSRVLGTEIINNIKVCIVGRPNVGKSSLINKLIGEDRIIVSAIPHTTREPQDIAVGYKEARITFVDTAGLSRQGQKSARQEKIQHSLEKLSIDKSLSALGSSDIALLVIDSSADIDRQEQKIVDKILERKNSLIVIANKWDLTKDKDTKKFTKMIYSHLPFITWAPIHFCSALTGEKVNKIFNLILKINEARNIQIVDNALSKFLIKTIKWQKPALGKFAKRPRIYDFKQIQTDPPVFSLRIGARETLQYSYIKYIENRLRKKFGFLGTPISIWVEKKKKVHGKAD